MLAKKLQQAVAGQSLGGATYVEDVFSTYLFQTSESNQKITNNIDLLNEGGLVWLKNRAASGSHLLFDTERGASAGYLSSNNTNAQSGSANFITTFYEDGFDQQNIGASSFVSWTFRKAPKFFDVVTWTGDGTNSRTIAHNLGSQPGCVIVKRTDSTQNWYVWHTALPDNQQLLLNLTNAAGSTSNWYEAGMTSTTFGVNANTFNTSGATYVTYLFAHDAGGFGDSGDQSVIKCGSFTKSSGVVYSETLGWEPQWLLFKRTDASENWFMIDNMRGMTVGGTDAYLIPNLTNAEGNLDFVTPTPTGFEATNNFNNGTYIYIAIRRGPMKTPEDATKVFAPTATSTTVGTQVTIGFPMDSQFVGYRSGSSNNFAVYDRLRGFGTKYNVQDDAYKLITSSTAAEVFNDNAFYGVENTGWQQGSNTAGISTVRYDFRRAPGFFDVVCYTGDGVAGREITHNLTVSPELIIAKARDYSGGRPWPVYHSGVGASKFLYLNQTDGAFDNTLAWYGVEPTSTVFTVGSNSVINYSATNYVAYLFASVPGVSKVGSFTQVVPNNTVVDCGFSNGARFVLIKRTDSTSDWYVWDSARGIISGNDPYLRLNLVNVEVTASDCLIPNSSGFETNGNWLDGGTYIYLAIA